jgi:hypothetical protein
MAALTPIEVPAKALVKGTSQTIKMINGTARKALIIKLKRRLHGAFSIGLPFRVRNKVIPNGSPIKKPKHPDNSVI